MTIDIHLHYTVPVEIPAVWATFLQERTCILGLHTHQKDLQVF